VTLAVCTSCGALTVSGAACPRCGAGRRPTSHERGYGAAWRKGLRRRQLRREPVCQYMTPDGERCARMATDVDHIVPKSQGGADELANLQSLCHAHHSMKTVREGRGRPRP
jgi:5-methylcytosine-specific restriction protein A